MTTKIPLERTLTQDDFTLLQQLGEAASQRGVELWLVGGAVRDTLLGAPVTDIDLTAERPAGEVAAFLAADGLAQPGGRSQFGTVKLRVRDRTIDLATARRETYARPGALPRVRPGSMHDDLARRDITVNAMAASLLPARFGVLLDPFNGAEDLQQQVVRILHNRSFQDDATRIFRVIRYAARLGFRIEPRTLRWLRRGVPYLDAISPARIHREIERTLAEPRAIEMLQRACRLGVISALHPGFNDARVAAALHRARRAGARQAVHPLGLLGYAVQHEAEAVTRRLGLTRSQARIFLGAAQLRRIESAIAEAGAPSRVHALAARLPRTSIETCAVVASSAVVRRRLRAYLAALDRGQPPLAGRDLLRMGAPEGPLVGRLLHELEERWLDGAIRSKPTAERYARRRIRELAGAAGSAASERSAQ